MKIRDRIRELRRVPASELRPNPKNWRTHPQAQADALKGVLAEIGIADAVLARELDDGSLMLLDGHLRVETMGDQTLPVLVLDVDAAEGDKVLATLDPLAAMAESDAAKLDAILREVDTGSPELQQMLADLADDAGLYQNDAKEIVEDEIPEPPVDPITKPGDLWILGEHRLLCGDSTKAEDVERLLAGVKAGMMVTDPPYGVNYDPEMRSTAKSVGKIANDDRASWLDAWSLFAGDVAYVWHASLFTSVVLADLESAGLRHVSMIIWKKPYATFSMANYHWQHEPCWYCVRPSGTRNWIGSPKESTVWDMTQPKDPYGRSGEDKTPHPTQKPVEAMARPMRNHDHQIVYDPFLGSGTTLIAAEQLGRKCYGMEISPQYCDVIVKRWETLTGKKATRQG
jgi:DNA modification methylase